MRAMTALATAIVLLVFGPPLIIGLVLLALLGIGVFSDGPQAVKKTFRCPLRARRVTAEFVVPAGAARPCSVVSCTAFKDPKQSLAPNRALAGPRSTGPHPGECSRGGR